MKIAVATVIFSLILGGVLAFAPGEPSDLGSSGIQRTLAKSSIAEAAVVLESPWKYSDYQKALASKDNPRAKAILIGLIKSAPAAEKWLSFSLAEIILADGDTPAAVEIFSEIARAEEYAIGFRSLEKLAAVSAATGDHLKAAEQYKVLSERVAGEESYRFRLKEAQSLIASGSRLEGETIFREVLLSKTHPQFRMLAAAELDRTRADAGVSTRVLGDIFYNGGDFPMAAEQYEKALASAPSTSRAEILFQLGRSRERADHFKDAIKVYERLAKEHPAYEPVEVAYYTGLCYQRIGKDEKGEAYFKKVLKDSPRSTLASNALYRMATRRDKKEKRAEAFQYYNRILKEFPRSRWADEAAWRIGFAQLEDGKLKEASQAFATAVKRFPRSDYAGAMGYWRARILEDLGDPSAIERFSELIRSSNDPYYIGRSALALRRLGVSAPEDWARRVTKLVDSGKVLDALSELKLAYYLVPASERAMVSARMSEVFMKLPQWAGIQTADIATQEGIGTLGRVLGDGDLAQEVALLSEIGAYQSAADEIIGLTPPAEITSERRIFVAQVLARGGRHREAIREVEKVLREEGGYLHPAALPPTVASILYPSHYFETIESEAAKRGLDPYFALAVIREESRFDAQIASWAGAQGLMQIMPGTGRSVAKSMGLAGFAVSDLLQPEVNIAIGTHYLKHLSGLYDGQYYLALAGYNAGPGNANRWLRQNATASEEIWIEKISFNETRKYVKRVLGTYWIYSQLNGAEIRSFSAPNIAKLEALTEEE